MAQYIIPTIFTAVDKMSAPMLRMKSGLSSLSTIAGEQGARLQRRLGDISATAMNTAKNAGIMGASMLAPLGLAANSAVDFEDKMSDIAKTTGLAGKDLKLFGEGILTISKTTRSGIDDLLKIGEIGGQLGVAKDELISFTAAADKFNIALGKDYGGGVAEAISSVGKINTLFAQTRNLKISESITRAGSVINELGAQGAGTSQNINDFILRMGALPDALKPSMTATAALGTLFEEMGIDAQIGAGGLTQLFLDASKNMAGFSAQMKITTAQASEMLKTDPTAFATRFAVSLKGMPVEQTALLFKKLSIASNEEIKVLGALGSGTERLTALQQIANTEFAQGTSLTNEAAKKNETLAAKMAIAKNNIQALSITVGTELVPVLTKIIGKITPVISTISEWVSNHKALAGIILKSVAVIGTLALVVSGAAFAVGTVTKAIWLWNMALKVAGATQGFVAVVTGTLNGALLAQAGASRGAALGIQVMNTSALGLLATFTKLAAVTGIVYGVMKLMDKKDEQKDRMNAILAHLPAGVDKEKFSNQFQDIISPGHISLVDRLKGVKSLYPQSLYDSLGKQFYDDPKAKQDSIIENMPKISEEYMRQADSAYQSINKTDTAIHLSVNVNGNDVSVSGKDNTGGAVPVFVTRTGYKTA